MYSPSSHSAPYEVALVSPGPSISQEGKLEGIREPKAPSVIEAAALQAPTSKSCTFIFPTRRHAARLESKQSGTDMNQDAVYFGTEDLRTSPSRHKQEQSVASASEKPAFNLSPRTPPVLEQDVSPRSEHFGPLPTSSSTGTFGRLGRDRARSNVSAAMTSPGSEGFHSTSFSRTTTQSPLNQSFIPSRLPTSSTEDESDASNDSPAISTPADVLLHPCLSKNTDVIPSPEADQTFISEGRSSLFTISAYEREDNVYTPMLGKAFSDGTKPCDHSPMPPSPPPMPPSIPNNSQEGVAPLIIPSESTSSILRRNRRPTPLILNHINNYESHVSPVSGQILDHSSVDSGSRKSSTGHGPASSSPFIPAIEYVKTIQIELWIDQEEHRAIRPVFAYKRRMAQQHSPAKLNHQRPSTMGKDQANSKDKDKFWNSVTESGLVDLRMVAKEVGTFHCGKISREAIIRRLVINGDDEKDYLSCNVILPLKDNGVYAVYGTEQEKGRKGPARTFAWKFEYTIEDKRNPQTSQILDGEKILRPISFICSPEMLAPSQASNVTIMHLLSKKLSPSPSATRIPPPSIPASTPASVASSDVSVSSEPSFFSTMTRKSRIGTAVKTVSRPTTPATDKRLRSASESKRSSISSTFLTSALSIGLKDSSKAHRPHDSPGIGFLMAPPSFRIEESRSSPIPSIFPSSRSKSSALRQSNKPIRASKSHFGVILPQRPHTSETSMKRPHTASHTLRKSVRHVSGTIFGKISSSKRPATAGHSQTGSPLLRDTDPVFLRPNRAQTEIVTYAEPWRMPTEEEITKSLSSMSLLVRREHKRLEVLARNHNAKGMTLERLDSSGELSMLDEEPRVTVRNIEVNIVGKHIAPPKALDHWTSSPLGAVRRPSTSHGLSPSPAGSSRSIGLTDPRRPGTTDGAFSKSSPFGSDASFRSPSVTSLGLPIPPRKPRSSSTKLS